jgi:hypothetical protein
MAGAGSHDRTVKARANNVIPTSLAASRQQAQQSGQNSDRMTTPGLLLLASAADW